MTEVVFHRRGNCFVPMPGAATQYNELPPGVYTVAVHENNLHLVVADDLAVPGKIYGDTEKRAQRVVKSFLARPDITTGVLLNGEKGTGKTVLGKRVSELLRTQHKVPTLLITDAFSGTGFAQFLSAIKQPCVVLIDEFEKVYGGEQGTERQNGLLSILDGAFSGHKLFIFTTNAARLEDSFFNRPGRIHYRWNYQSLEPAVVREYAKDHLKNQQHLEELVRLMRLVEVSSFDVLKGLIWEMNQYGEPASEVIPNLNIDWSPNRFYRAMVAGSGEYSGKDWDVTCGVNVIEQRVGLTLERNPIPTEQRAKLSAAGLPPSGMIYSGKESDEERLAKFEEKFIRLDMGPEDLRFYDPEEDVYEFQKGDFFARLTPTSLQNQGHSHRQLKLLSVAKHQEDPF